MAVCRPCSSPAQLTTLTEQTKELAALAQRVTLAMRSHLRRTSQKYPPGAELARTFLDRLNPRLAMQYALRPRRSARRWSAAQCTTLNGMNSEGDTTSIATRAAAGAFGIFGFNPAFRRGGAIGRVNPF